MIDRVVTVAEPGRVILVAGGAAAGKSALCAAVRADMAASAHVVHVAATATATPYLDTLVGILSALGFRVESDTDPQALIELIAHEAVQADDAPLCLVIIDDAHALPFGDLQALIGLLAGSRLCLVLTGPDSLTLLVEGLAGLNHCRCSVLGLNDEPPPEPVIAPPTDRGAALPTIPKKHLIALASLAAVMIIGWVVARFAEESSVGVSSTARVETLAMPPQGGPGAVASGANAVEGEAGTATESLAIPGSGAREPGVESPTGSQSPTGAQSATGSETPTGAETPAKPRPIIARPSGAAGAATNAASAPPPAKPSAAAATRQPAAGTPATATPTPPARAPVAAQTAAAPTPAAAAPAGRPAATAASGGRGADWILAQPGARFTLQLVSLSSAERARSYVSDQPDANAFATYRLMRNGQLFHVVVYGSFATRAEATTAAGRLPRSVGNVQPWVRTFAQVQQSVRATPQ